MLKSCGAIYENGEVTWLAEQLHVKNASVIVTILEEIFPTKSKGKNTTIIGAMSRKEVLATLTFEGGTNSSIPDICHRSACANVVGWGNCLNG